MEVQLELYQPQQKLDMILLVGDVQQITNFMVLVPYQLGQNMILIILLNVQLKEMQAIIQNVI